MIWFGLYNVYRAERDKVPEAAESDYVLVNLWRPPLGRAFRPDSVERLFVRLSARVGFRARPHMLRHSFASEVAVATKDPALVKELLGHHSVVSSNVYMHARWNDMRAAVDGHARRTWRRPMPGGASHTRPGRSGRNGRGRLGAWSGSAAGRRTASARRVGPRPAAVDSEAGRAVEPAKACAVAGCPHDRDGTHPFCHGPYAPVRSLRSDQRRGVAGRGGPRIGPPSAL